METIFDFGVTDKELKEYFGANSKEEYLRERNYNETILLWNLAYLLMLRGDDRFKHYADMLPWDMRQEVYRDASEYD